ncbi:uncharacterized protein LOC121984314 isoform X3 [Zingiber officinale]|uniref:uncharacterized protein LOC121984314 isoform X3 n=1 Tax=Zingiber officinale TaxID=94328 RepID=UPI001C4C06CF|nr:uncharacterized protein LOC121984314 isoform X3 [Zingiber officinale]
MELNEKKDDPAVEEPKLSDLGFAYLRPVGAVNGDLVCLRSDRVYTVGRRRRHCDLVLPDRCISNRHCQVFLDGAYRKLRLLDGFLLPRRSHLREIRRGFRSETCCTGSRVSRNGVFVNGRRVRRGAVAELAVGDEVLFSCRSGTRYGCRIKRGFSVELIVFSEVKIDRHNPLFTRLECGDVDPKSLVLLRHLRSTLSSNDPVSYLRNLINLPPALEHALRASLDSDKCAEWDNGQINHSLPDDAAIHIVQSRNSNSKNDGAIESSNCETLLADGRGFNHSDGRTFFLNRLKSIGPSTSDYCEGVSLAELLHPLKTVVRIFIATFTCDVSWFLSCFQVPNHLEITIACHNTERCWSADQDSRTSQPYVNYPNLLLVYPMFPDEIAFGKDRKKQGVACHHPKLIVLQRDESLRVIVTSANLVPKQWDRITNTVWWQDFPCRATPDYSALFEETELKIDFAAQLAGFVASLLVDVPSQAHWINELSKYDFEEATCYLVASVPGIHSSSPCNLEAHYCLSISCNLVFYLEMLQAAIGERSMKIQLLINVSKGSRFTEMPNLITPEHFVSLCLLVASLQRRLGLWRLREVLSQYRWPESLEVDFVYGASSIGASVDLPFFSAFAAAAGKKSCYYPDSEESDPEWGHWSIANELKRPSIKILFPTIERVKNGHCGIHSSRRLLSLSEKTWQRLKIAGIFHDAVPRPCERVGYPMHVKLAQRQFLSGNGMTTFGWIYVGSHNFSPAAWGRTLLPSSKSKVSEASTTTKLHICNYELGIILIVPPTDHSKRENVNNFNLKDIILPFVMPAPIYKDDDRPATAQAMREALSEATLQSLPHDSLPEDGMEDKDFLGEEEMFEEPIFPNEENDEERVYAEMLWSQVDSSGS